MDSSGCSQKKKTAHDEWIYEAVGCSLSCIDTRMAAAPAAAPAAKRLVISGFLLKMCQRELLYVTVWQQQQQQQQQQQKRLIHGLALKTKNYTWY